MRRNLTVLVTMLVAALLLSNVPMLSQPPAKAESSVSSTRTNIGSQQKAQLDFASPVELEEALILATRTNLTITQIQHSFTLGEETFTGIFPIDAETPPDTIPERMVANYRGFLHDVLREAEGATIRELALEALDNTASAKKRMKSSEEAERALIDSYREKFRVEALTVYGTPDQIDAAVKESGRLISRIDPADVKTALAQESQTKMSATQEQANANVDENTWVPTSGKVVTAAATEGGRYVRQEMRWSSVSGFGPESTYEHDFFLKNSAGAVRPAGTYLSRSETLIDRIPKVEYATSTLPRAYLDSRFGDGNDEIAFTIGSAKASDIKANQTYSSYIRTKDGDATQDDGKLQAQLGHRTPSWCYTTFCSFEDKQVPRVTLVRAWEVPVPGVKTWDRNIGPTAHFSMNAQNKTANDPGTLNLAAPVNGNVPVTLRSTSTQGTSPINKWVWKSNGTSICTSSTCTFKFGTASNTITLTVTDSNGKTSNASGLVKLTFQPSGPTAHFSMNAQNRTANDPGTLNLTVPINGNVPVTLQSTSTQGNSPITKWVWKSNGTTICTSATCTFKFGTASNTITLTVTDRNGKTSTANGLVKVTFQPAGPTAHFSMSAQNKSVNDPGTLNLTVPVNGNVSVTFRSTSTQGNSSISKWVWKSNGTTICTSATCTFKFGTASNTITLTVTDRNGKVSTASGLVKLTFQAVGPTAHFTMSAQNKNAKDGGTLRLSVPVNASIVVKFASKSVRGSDPIRHYVWKSNGTRICSDSSRCDFRFGTTSNTITLIVTDSKGKSSTATGLVRLR
jgi:hypothetical protein